MDNPKSIWKLALHFRANFSRTWENNYNTLKSTQLANGNSALSLSQTNGMNGIFFRLLSLVKAYLGTSAVVQFINLYCTEQRHSGRFRGAAAADQQILAEEKRAISLQLHLSVTYFPFSLSDFSNFHPSLAFGVSLFDKNNTLWCIVLFQQFLKWSF